MREHFIAKQADLDVSRLVFIDEAGSHIAMTREYARSPRGERVNGSVPRNRGTVTTILGALTLHGIAALMTVEGATDAEVFEAFVEHSLIPVLRPGDTVVLDNLGAHRMCSIRRKLEAAGAQLLYLPPYSPELNPIEECWSKLKTLLRSAAARTREDLDSAIAKSSRLISPSDALGWIRHAGYLCGIN